MYRFSLAVCGIDACDYQVTIADVEIEGLYEKEHAIFLAEKYDYLARHLPQPVAAVVLYDQVTVAPILLQKRSAEFDTPQPPTKRFCTYVTPSINKAESVKLKYKRISFKKTRFQSSYTYNKVLRPKLLRKCKQGKRRLFTPSRKLFCCKPREYPRFQTFSCSVLYPKVYKHTEPDANFDFSDDNIDDAQSLELYDYTFKHKNKRNMSKSEEKPMDTVADRLLKTDCSDLQDEFDALQLDDNFETPTATSTDFSLVPLPKKLDTINTAGNVSALKDKLKKAKKRRSEMQELFTEKYMALKKIKKDYDYYDRKVCELANVLDLRTTVDAANELKFKDEKIPNKFARRMAKLENKLEPIEENLTSSDLLQSTTVKLDIKLEPRDFDDMFSKHATPKHTCSICTKQFVELSSFRSHIQSHAGKKYKCEKCTDRVFSIEKSYESHLRWHKKGEPYFYCKICPKKFEFPYRLKNHKRTHKEASLKCRVHDICKRKGKVFTFESERKSHELYWDSPNRFECGTCYKLLKLQGASAVTILLLDTMGLMKSTDRLELLFY